MLRKIIIKGVPVVCLTFLALQYSFQRTRGGGGSFKNRKTYGNPVSVENMASAEIIFPILKDLSLSICTGLCYSIYICLSQCFIHSLSIISKFYYDTTSSRIQLLFGIIRLGLKFQCLLRWRDGRVCDTDAIV